MVTELSPSPATRFSNSAENYIKYRPGYPEEILTYVEATLGLTKEAAIADIGSGTGLFAELLLQEGYAVTCMETDNGMRKAGTTRLGHYRGFKSLAYQAGDTGLPDHQLDLVTVARAFHWIDPVTARYELKRMLKTGGSVVLSWNIQRTGNFFLKTFAALQEKYRLSDPEPCQMEEEAINAFFGTGNFTRKIFPNTQMLNFDALKGQLLAAAFIPLPGHTSYETMISELVQLFVVCNENGFVKMEFDTIVYTGRLDEQ